MKAAGSAAALRAFASSGSPLAARCDACGAPLEPSHDHRLWPRERRLQCVCAACASGPLGPGSTWKRVQTRATPLTEFRFTEEQWGLLGIPVRLAFFVVVADDEPALAFFPSPGGATELRLDPNAWEGVRAGCPALRTLAPDVEALLVNHVAGASDHYLVSIDLCYRLVGTIRAYWRGFGGGARVWGEIAILMDGIRREGGACA